MTTESPSQNDRNWADERAVRSFLERAAPIILESQVLDDPRFESVCHLADQLGLSRDQLACELRLLQQRGVITSAPWDRLDAVTPARDQIEDTTDSAARPALENHLATRQPPTPQPTAWDTPVTPRSVRPPVPLEISATAQAVEALRDRAIKILERRGTVTPRTRRKLEQAGKQAGLSPSQVAAVLDALVDAGRSGTAAEPPARSEGSPATQAPLPPAAQTAVEGSVARPAPTPSELFRRWIAQKLAGYPSMILTVDDEQGLVGVGVHRYHLAEVLSSHVVRDVATEHGLRLERDLDAASCNSTVATATQQSADDNRLQEFFEQVAPILTQHRGINVQSRVMMNAVAERLGLSQQELERALATLQRHTRDPDEEDPRQLERRESFRAYLRRALAQLPNGIVTFQTHWRLCQAGEHFHGVAPQWIESTIKEVAAEIGARFISKEQAIEHITHLVENQLGERPAMDNTTRARVYSEGTRWGLDPMDVDSVIRERTESLRRQLAAERRRTRHVINFVIGGLATAGIIIVALFLFRPVAQKPATTDGSWPQTDQPPPPRQLRGLPWWDDKLRIAQARLRITRPDLRPVLDALSAEQPVARGTAYEQLIRQYTGKLPSKRRRGECEQLLVGAFALEASDIAASQISTALVDPLADLDHQLPDSPATVDLFAWICEVAAAMLKNADTPLLRRNSLGDQLNAATGATLDPLLDAEALASTYRGALARRLYPLLTSLAADDAARAAEYYGNIHSLAASSLSPAEQDALEIQFLAAALPAAADHWDRYADALVQAAKSTDPSTVIKLLDIYRRATDDRLRNYLAGLFFDRLGAEPGALTESEMIQQLRESLGVASQERLLRRWQQVDALAEELLSRPRVDNTNPDVLIQQVVELAHAATLACALTRGEAGIATFDEVQTKGPVALTLAGGPWSTVSPAEYASRFPVPKTTVLETNIASLTTARTADQRIALLNLIANQTQRVPDIDPAAGQTLAEYLVAFKSDEQEHQRLLPFVPPLYRWSSVRLALADRILDVTGRDPQFQEVLAAALDTDVSLSTQQERDELRKRLLAEALGNLADISFSEDPTYAAFDQGSDAVRDSCAQQAQLLGVPLENYQGATRASDVVLALMNQITTLLDTGRLDSAEKQFLASLPHQTRAIDFVADSDLQYTAAVQRLWLQVLALHVLGQRPESATTVRRIVTESAATQSSQPRVFEQLRDVHTSLLQLWMVLRPSFDAATLEGLEGLAESASEREV